LLAVGHQVLAYEFKTLVFCLCFAAAVVLAAAKAAKKELKAHAYLDNRLEEVSCGHYPHSAGWRAACMTVTTVTDAWMVHAWPTGAAFMLHAGYCCPGVVVSTLTMMVGHLVPIVC
jgi:hypothetical protein